MSWFRFIRWVLFAIAALGGALYGFILMLDPYQDVPFSPALPRAPVSTNQRFAYPALARNAEFDSAIVGTSTMRLLDPARLNQLTGARFVNIAMNSATAYEQARIYELFMRHHPHARYLVLGNDGSWCSRDAKLDKYTFRDFPEWMYDDNRWNDLLYLFNDKALENAVRMLELLAGRREAKYRNDGYRDFTRDFASFDPRQLEQRLYRGPRTAIGSVAVEPNLTQPGWDYPVHDMLLRLLENTPGDTRIILLYPPVHAHYLLSMAANMRECKGRIERLLAAFANVTVLDYMSVSALTRDDANYWDSVHFTNRVARLVEDDVAAAIDGLGPISAYARELVPAHAARAAD